MALDRFRVPAEHPCLSGHFPGTPVSPGVVLLDAIFVLLHARFAAEVAAIDWVKFLAPVPPDQELEVAFEARDGRVGFSAVLHGRRILHGVARLTAEEPGG